MPRLAANLSFLFPRIEFPDRFAAAARAGFRAVEYQFPYAWPKDACMCVSSSYGFLPSGAFGGEIARFNAGWSSARTGTAMVSGGRQTVSLHACTVRRAVTTQRRESAPFGKSASNATCPS
jgi:hypothetical protein